MLSQIQGQMADSELAEGAFNLEQVLGDGARDSGGRHVQVVSPALVNSLRQIADELRHQYEVSYVLPSGTTPSDKIAVSSKRKDVVVRAPTRIPN